MDKKGKSSIRPPFLAIAAMAILLSSCDQPSTEESLPAGTTVRTIPFAKGTTADLTVDRAGTIHVVWAGEQTFYQRSGDGGGSWSRPVFVGKGSMGRIFAADSTLHYVTYMGIDHYVSRDQGNHWTETGPLLPLVRGGHPSFDGVCVGDTLLLAYLEEDRRDSVVVLRLARFEGSREMDHRELGRVRFRGMATYPQQPRIRVQENDIFVSALVTSFTRERRADEGQALHEVPYSQLSLWHSSDRGLRWENTPGPKFEESELSWPTDAALYLASGNPELAIAYQGLSVFAPRRDGWSSLHRSSHGPGFNGEGINRNNDTEFFEGTDLHAWFDSRHQWELWNWRGFFMNPEDAFLVGQGYRNNDVFVIVARGADHGQEFRLTQSPAYASNIRVQVSEGHFLVLWAGRSKVGRSLDAFGAKPEVFLARIPVKHPVAHR